MTRDEILTKLREQKEWLAEQGIIDVRLYGSFARDEAREDSDVDLMVDLAKPIGWEFYGIEEELGRRLGRTVEMATEDAMHRLVLKRALAEAVGV